MRFTDPETQELFEKCKWSSLSEDAFIAHVEAKLRREGEKCEWEIEHSTHLNPAEPLWEIIGADGKYHEPKFCPRCGRSLEAK